MTSLFSKKNLAPSGLRRGTPLNAGGVRVTMLVFRS
jgi:hypothetical protein